MLHNGFKNVFHLEGGIIQYANKIKEEKLPNKFQGKNFVFDGRLGEMIGDEVISDCHQCGAPADTIPIAPMKVAIFFLYNAVCAEKYKGCCSAECKEYIICLKKKENKIAKA